MHIVSCMFTKFYEVPCSGLRGVTLTTTKKKQDRRTGQKNNTTCIFVARGIINVFEGFQKQDEDDD